MVMVMGGMLPPLGAIRDNAAFWDLQRSVSRRNRVLIVESDRALRDAVTGALGIAIPAVGAGTGREAIRLIDEFNPTIVVMNLQLLDMDGLDLLRRVRDRFSGSKVIVTSDSGDHDLVIQVTALGVGDFLEKPYSTDELFRSLDNSMRGICAPIDDQVLMARYHEKSRLRLRSLMLTTVG